MKRGRWMWQYTAMIVCGVIIILGGAILYSQDNLNYTLKYAPTPSPSPTGTATPKPTGTSTPSPTPSRTPNKCPVCQMPDGNGGCISDPSQDGNSCTPANPVAGKKYVCKSGNCVLQVCADINKNKSLDCPGPPVCCNSAYQQCCFSWNNNNSICCNQNPLPAGITGVGGPQMCDRSPQMPNHVSCIEADCGCPTDDLGIARNLCQYFNSGGTGPMTVDTCDLGTLSGFFYSCLNPQLSSRISIHTYIPPICSSPSQPSWVKYAVLFSYGISP